MHNYFLHHNQSEILLVKTINEKIASLIIADLKTQPFNFVYSDITSNHLTISKEIGSRKLIVKPGRNRMEVQPDDWHLLEDDLHLLHINDFLNEKNSDNGYKIYSFTRKLTNLIESSLGRSVYLTHDLYFTKNESKNVVSAPSLRGIYEITKSDDFENQYQWIHFIDGHDINHLKPHNTPKLDDAKMECMDDFSKRAAHF